ncbi:MAG: peptidoglycan glycosyltransferase [Myxococcota bacterium]|jgi:peptidoglycan glycosyltransferase
MFALDNKGLKISAALGLTCGLALAFVMWRETPPPREVLSKPRAASIRPAADTSTQAATTSAGQPRTTTPGDTTAPSIRATPRRAQSASANRLPVAELDLRAAKEKDGRLVQKLSGKRVVEYTVMEPLQRRAEAILQKADVPFGSLVAMEPSTGRVLAYAQHSSLRPEMKNLPGMANPPAASVFKVITAAALLEHARVSPDHRTCFHGGSRGLRLHHLKDNPNRDVRCATLTEALGKSTNAVFGKLADQNLTPAILDKYTKSFGFNREIPFVLPVQMSKAEFPADRLTFAQVSAGFYHTHLSPMHGAMVASAVANGGVMVAPKLVERFLVNGIPTWERKTTPLGRAIHEKTARVLSNMMVSTTETGTAGPYFRNRADSLKGIRVAGKTGTLSVKAEDGTRHRFSWFVGFAPADNPRIAISALVVNVGEWRIKGAYLAREAFETYFETIQKTDISQR